MKTNLLLLALLTLGCLYLHGQNPYGYQGHRLYLQYNFGASVNLIGNKPENPTALPYLNRFHDLSLNYCLNRHWVAGIHGMYSRDVADIEYTSAHIFDSRKTYTPFRTTEVGIQFYRFINDLNAPLGTYLNVGLGMAITELDGTVRASVITEAANWWNSTHQETVFSYTQTRPYLSPMLRLGIGTQHLIGNHLMINVAGQLGLNLAWIHERRVATDIFSDDNIDSSEMTSNEDLESLTKSATQSRISFKNFYHFRLGIGYLF
ncbi:hypothetical protein KFE98_04190 [bacterium SCSIO 12741]|nr:hypothetical protein KFE98_04190 [bacterium SCSIO 12741]